MKLFVFNSIEEWTTDVCHAVFAETEEKARAYLLAIYKPHNDNYTVKEVEIFESLILEADGYDETRMIVHA